ncbi:MAG: hypothetical protein K5647_06205 [Clostridiales bacterium]|nr:hypothetical protein [Clostridiales bacterium]
MNRRKRSNSLTINDSIDSSSNPVYTGPKGKTMDVTEQFLNTVEIRNRKIIDAFLAAY